MVPPMLQDSQSGDAYSVPMLKDAVAVVDAFVVVDIPVAVVDVLPFVIMVELVPAIVLVTADVDPVAIICELACAVILELACAVIVELSCAVIDELACAVDIDEVEAFACCEQHIKDNASVRRRGKIILISA